METLWQKKYKIQAKKKGKFHFADENHIILAYPNYDIDVIIL